MLFMYRENSKKQTSVRWKNLLDVIPSPHATLQWLPWNALHGCPIYDGLVQTSPPRKAVGNSIRSRVHSHIYQDWPHPSGSQHTRSLHSFYKGRVNQTHTQILSSQQGRRCQPSWWNCQASRSSFVGNSVIWLAFACKYRGLSSVTLFCHHQRLRA